MPSTGKQKVEARKYRKMDKFSDFGNMDVMLGEGNSNSLERELDNVLNGPEGQQDPESVSNRDCSSQRGFCQKQTILPSLPLDRNGAGTDTSSNGFGIGFAWK